MAYDEIQAGSVIEYQYLWHREAARGEDGGRKPRPTAVAFRSHRPDADRIFLLPITSKRPSPGTIGLEIPEIEKRRAGLDSDVRLWVIVSEMNVDRIPGSYVLEPDSRLGELGKPFFRSVLRLLKDHLASATVVDRQ